MTLTDADREYGRNVVANGRNWNYLKLVTRLQGGTKGHYLTEIRFKFTDEDVMVIVKKDSPKGPMVAFTGGPTLDHALYNLAFLVKSKGLRWKADKWRTIRSDS